VNERRESRTQLETRQQIKDPGCGQLGTNQRVVTAQNGKNVWGGVSLVNICGLQFGD
jgi:hypothetical protein